MGLLIASIPCLDKSLLYLPLNLFSIRGKWGMGFETGLLIYTFLSHVPK